MMPRIVRSTKLLAVALVAPMSAAPPIGCTPRGDATPEVASAERPVHEAPASSAPTEAATEASVAGAAAAADATAAPATATPASAAPVAAGRPPTANPDPALYPLAAELDAVGEKAAFARLSHFRPLCDADGYPLVGNLVRKGPPPTAGDGYPPSRFCADVRRKETR